METLNPIVHGVMVAMMIGLFLGICRWAWSSQRKETFSHAAQIPLEDDSPVEEHSKTTSTTAEKNAHE